MARHRHRRVGSHQEPIHAEWNWYPYFSAWYPEVTVVLGVVTKMVTALDSGVVADGAVL